MKISKKKLFLGGLLAGAVLLVALVVFPTQASAQFVGNPGGAVGSVLANADLAGKAAGFITGVLAAPILYAILVLNLVFATIGGLVISFASWMIQSFIEANTGIGGAAIVNSLMVKAGFSIVLSVANLGFVAAIIFIAVATILRLQTYNVKKTLWKLIIAALLVNFSLVFAGAIINMSDQLSGFFLQQTGGAAGLVTGLIDVFNPFRFFNPQAGLSIAQQAQSSQAWQGFMADFGE